MGEQHLQRAVILHKLDPEDVAGSVSTSEVAVPIPKAGEALVNIFLRPVNPADIASIRPTAFPAVPGIEGVGRVVSSSGRFEQNQRVIATGWPIQGGNGTWQEYYAVPEDLLVAVPDDVSDQQAAIFWSNPVTAVGLLRTLDTPKGEWLLQTAAGGAIGRQIIQIARDYGLKTINFVRRSSQRQELLDLGADVVIASGEDEIGSTVQRITGGKGVYAALDAVGGCLTAEILSAVRPQGTLIIYGSLSGATVSARNSDLISGEKVMRGFRMTPWFKSHDRTARKEVVEEVFRLLADVISPYGGGTYPLKEVKTALRESLKPAKGGKIFLSN